MRNLTTTLCLTIAVLLGSVGVSWSGDFEKGGTAYDKGDYATAIREWTPLAKQGDADAQFNLGLTYAKVQGVLNDHKKAIKWLSLSAEQGHADARVMLGNMHHRGHGIPQDYKTAVKWYRLAAEQGNALAQSKMVSAYFSGEGVIKDNVYAHMWGNLAASNGSGIGGKLRDLIAKQMTPSQLEKAQDLARECVRKKYKGC